MPASVSSTTWRNSTASTRDCESVIVRCLSGTRHSCVSTARIFIGKMIVAGGQLCYALAVLDARDLPQAWPRPSAPRPIVVVGAGAIVEQAHLHAYRRLGLDVAGFYDVKP